MTNRRDFIRAGSTIAALQCLHWHGFAFGETTNIDIGPALANPFLTGGFAPIHDELTIDNLPIKGEVPREMAGIYMRNGPNTPPVAEIDLPRRVPHGFHGNWMPTA